jgi:hypothetical protein
MRAARNMGQSPAQKPCAGGLDNLAALVGFGKFGHFFRLFLKA